MENKVKPFLLVGHFFHVLEGDDRTVRYQGEVVGQITSEIYMVEYFEFLLGTPWDRQLKSLTEMKDWRFYDSAEWMRNAYRDTYAPRQRLQEVQDGSES